MGRIAPSLAPLAALVALPSVSVGHDAATSMVLPLICVTLAASHEVPDGHAGRASLAHGAFFALEAYGFALALDQDRAPQAAVILAVLLPVSVGFARWADASDR